MFKLKENYEFPRNILKCDFIRQSSSEMGTINTANSQKNQYTYRRFCYFSLKQLP